jgi:K+-transporting ATPase KdpF subunit
VTVTAARYLYAFFTPSSPLLITTLRTFLLYPSEINRINRTRLSVRYEKRENMEFALAAVIAFGLLVYLIYALFHPDDFQ